MSFHVPELARDTTHPILGSTSADLWRPTDAVIPTPPPEFVGPR